MSKPLYIGFSIYEFIWTLFLRLVCVCGLLYAIPNYDENPAVIMLFATLCVLFILILGDDVIVVYTDRVTQTTNSIWSYLFKKSHEEIRIGQLKRAYCEPPAQPGILEKGAAILLIAVLPTRSPNNKTIPIFFEFKSGDIKQFDTNLQSGQVIKIVETINALIK